MAAALFVLECLMADTKAAAETRTIMLEHFTGIELNTCPVYPLNFLKKKHILAFVRGSPGLGLLFHEEKKNQRDQICT